MADDPPDAREPESSSFDGDDEALEVTSVGDEIPQADLRDAALVTRGGKLGRYVVVDKLGSGAMGTVYRAYDPELDRGIAVKLVEIRASRWRRPAEIRARIMREAQAIARLQHPNVVQVFDVGEVEFAVWVAMEFVDGHTLKRWARQPGRTWQEILHAFVCAGEGLAAAHRADIVHRDFKPENVMIGHDGRIRVLDFGLARALSGPSTRDSARLDLDDVDNLPSDGGALETSLTAQGAVMGTPAYMAPEQHLAKPTRASTDQFSFCVSLWEALYGQRPFTGETHAVIAFAATRGKVTPPPSDRSVPRWVHAALLRGLQPQPDDRFADMTALIAALEANPARRRRRIAVSVAFVGAVAGAVVLTRSVQDDADTTVCNGAGDHLVGVWDAQRRAGVQESFAATELPYAADSFESTAATLDSWSEGWIEARNEACRATHVHGEQSAERLDLRMTCLSRQLTQLQALVDVLDTAERDVVVGSVQAAAALPSLSACADLNYLTAAVPPPTDPARAETLETLQTELTAVGARADAGAYRGLATRLDAVADPIAAFDHPPLAASFHSLRAEVSESTGDARGARTAWESAFASHLRSGDMASAAFVATKLVFIIGHRLSDREGGQRWSALARELARGVNDDGLIAASLWSAEGSMLSMHGDYEGSIAAERKASEYWLRESPDSIRLGISYGNIGNAETMRGNYELAAELIGKELELTRRVYGPHHPATGGVNARLASALSHGGHVDAALPIFRRAIAVLRQSEGDASTRVASAMDGLGRVLRKQGELEQAVAQHRQALAIYRKALGEQHPDVAVSLMHVGYTLAAMEHWADALAVFDEADAIFRKAVGDDHPQLIYVANSRATMHLMQERPAKAAPIAAAALALSSARQADPTLIAETQFILAQALWPEVAERPRALQLAGQSRDAYAAGPAVWADDLAKVRAWLDERQ